MKIYDSTASKSLSIKKLKEMLNHLGVERIFYKLLSPNDNSKNQPYMAGDISDISFIPTGEVTYSESASKKPKTSKRDVKYSIALNYSWISPEGNLYHAPNSKLIYYPQYPEVRLSGFVTRTGFDMNGWMDPKKKGRTEGRVLFLGVTNTDQIIAYLAIPESRLAKEVIEYPSIEVSGVLRELSFKLQVQKQSSKDVLLNELTRIHNKKWIDSKRIYRDGSIRAYTAQNGGGYTLEAELGISPNGYSEPDFMGWEVKQFGVKRCELNKSKALTLMTPEPDGGYYVEKGVEAFLLKYGHLSKKTHDRYDFTGTHYENKQHKKSGLTIILNGYDKNANLITNSAGCISLVNAHGESVADWSFVKVLEHWKKKHSKAVYIPSLNKSDSNKLKYYSYCSNIWLYEGTSFLKLLEAISSSLVYYDPGVKLENASTRPKIKRRNQFRIKSRYLDSLYNNKEEIVLCSDK